MTETYVWWYNEIRIPGKETQQAYRLFHIHMEELLVSECEVFGAVLQEREDSGDRGMRLRTYGEYALPGSRDRTPGKNGTLD